MVGALPPKIAGPAEIPFLRAASSEGRVAGHRVSPNPAAIVLATLLLPDTGRARVLGLDVVRQAAALKARINLVAPGGTISVADGGGANL